MPKLKTNKAASKRFRFTGTGKVKCSRAFANHNLTKKAMKRKRSLRQGAIVEEVDMKELRALLPYGN